jgi:hypothetical protein
VFYSSRICGDGEIKSGRVKPQLRQLYGKTAVYGKIEEGEEMNICPPSEKLELF